MTNFVNNKSLKVSGRCVDCDSRLTYNEMYHPKTEGKFILGCNSFSIVIRVSVKGCSIINGTRNRTVLQYLKGKNFKNKLWRLVCGYLSGFAIEDKRLAFREIYQKVQHIQGV